MKGGVQRLAVLFAAVAVAVGLGEVGLRTIFDRRTARFQRPNPLVCLRPNLYQRHDPYGYRLHPSRATTKDLSGNKWVNFLAVGCSSNRHGTGPA
jgi:hypothetical protein